MGTSGWRLEVGIVEKRLIDKKRKFVLISIGFYDGWPARYRRPQRMTA